MSDEDDRVEDRRLPLLYIVAIIVGMILSVLRMARYPLVLPTPLAYAIAIVAGVILAAFEATTLKRQIAYSIPFILMMVGAIAWVHYVDTHGKLYLRNKDIYQQSFVGTFPGLILYFVARWWFDR